MAPKAKVLVVSGIGVAVGLSVLITAAILLNELVDPLDRCRKLDAKCAGTKLWTAATSLGITAGSIQILSFISAWKKDINNWTNIQIFVCILVIIAFGIGVHEDGFSSRASSDDNDLPRTFVIFCLIDMIYTLIIAVLVLCNIGF